MNDSDTSTPFSVTKPNYLWRLILVISAVAGYRGLFIGLFGPGTDEAMYWDFARHLDWGYVDHPPLIAWVYRLLLEIFGDQVWVWRWCASFFTSASHLLLFFVGRRLYSERVGFWAAVSQAVSPQYSVAAGILLVPETLLIFWASLALWMTVRLMQTDHPRWFWFLGLVWGLGFLSKYPAVFIPFGILCFAGFSQAHRCWLKSRALVGMLTLGGLMFLPMVIWNAQHDWISLKFAFQRSQPEQSAFQPGLGLLGSSVIAQATYHSPLLFALVWTGIFGLVVRYVRKPATADLLILCFTLPTLILFQLISSTRFTLPHWPASAYALAYLAWPRVFLSDGQAGSHWKRTWITGSLVLAGVMTLSSPILLVYPVQTKLYQWLKPHFNLSSPPVEPLAGVAGWDDEVRDRIEYILRECRNRLGIEPTILTDYHMLAALLSYHLREVCLVMCVGPHAHQYNLWSDEKTLPNRPVLVIGADAICVDKMAQNPQELFQFQACESLPFLSIDRYGITVNRIHFWLCHGYQGLKK